MPSTEAPALRSALEKAVSGDVLFDDFSRGRYATDASFYQMMPLGVVVPENDQDVAAALAIARAEEAPVLARGAGTSQCGQTVNTALVLDTTKYLNKLLDLDVDARRCTVQPGMVLDELNRLLKPHGLCFPVDISTASRATIGGMAGNNSCGGRSIRYGTMRDNVQSISAILPDGRNAWFGPLDEDAADGRGVPPDLLRSLLSIGERLADEVEARFPKVLRRVGGYNLDALGPGQSPINLSHILVGSEGTLAYSKAIELKLSPLAGPRVTGICHFPTFRQAMAATQHLVRLNPIAVELIDRSMLDLASDIDLFRSTVDATVRGQPDALLLVEFAEGDEADNLARLSELETLMGDLGFSWQGSGSRWGGCVPVTDNRLQDAISDLRKSALNIMMSMKSEGKPVSFVEDCAVDLADLEAYTAGLTEIFEKHGTRGTWYAHASVGCLHVRPVLNLKLDQDVRKLRKIAEEAFALVRSYQGSHSGEHGDGILRSEFHSDMFGKEVVSGFKDVKNAFDPEKHFNPGKIVAAPDMDERALFRYSTDYKVEEFNTVLDWSDWSGAGGGLQGAVEMCNNNGACRKIKGGVMCPSFRVTRDERDLTRGRANSLRLAISGQLGKDALTSSAMKETMRLCVSCKGCKRECPTGVDMARMKIEVLAADAKQSGVSIHDSLIANLPRFAKLGSSLPWLFNAPNRIPAVARLIENIFGFSARRSLPTWRRDWFKDEEIAQATNPDIVLFADTFNRYFEPENLRAAIAVFTSAGLALNIARSKDGSRPLCCGRTYLSVGLIDEARREAKRLVAALLPYAERNIPIIGLEPSCLLALRDELPALLPGSASSRLSEQAMMLEEYLSFQATNGKLGLSFRSTPSSIVVHGHCHQKAMDVVPTIEKTLALLPDAGVRTIETSCCGMAGSFGYSKETVDVSLKMGELDLFPAVRKLAGSEIIVADGFSCRHQIKHGTGRDAIHVARLLEMALEPQEDFSP